MAAGVQKVSDESPALSPADALKTFYMPPGYRVELVASEPLVQDPDRDRLGSGEGRLWVVEMPGFVPNLTAPEPNMEPIGRIVVLEDTNNDGDDGQAHGLRRRPGARRGRSRCSTAACSSASRRTLWLMHDTNGDLQHGHEGAGHRSSTAAREARVEQNANDFHWALDNWMHTAERRHAICG